MAKKRSVKKIEPKDRIDSIREEVHSYNRTKSVNEIVRTQPTAIKKTKEFSAILQQIEHSTDSFFITGRAGTGKTTLLQLLKASTEKNIVVLAPTGVAAVNIGGSTIHSFFRFPLHFLREEDVRVFRDSKRILQSLDLLVVDEVSMVRADLLDAIDHSLRKHRKHPTLPFGGVQLALFGDLFQLPPVIETSLNSIYYSFYDTPYFFSAQVFQNTNLKTFELQQVFRQSDRNFIALLDRIRNNEITDEDIEILNSRVLHTHTIQEDEPYITLTSTNALAASVNRYRLQQLPGKELSYHATTEGDFPQQSYPTDENLVLKEGAQVMFLKNDSTKRWVNGTLGAVKKVTSRGIEVTVGAETYEVEPSTWERIVYSFDEEEKKIVPEVVGTFRQYPLTLAWAITIHKSQGKTFDRVVIDFGHGMFAHGQAYVALSRCRTFDGIFLKSPLRVQDIIVDERVVNFLQSTLIHQLEC
jgi:ATP-dependent exoDNAse (exonuclease V) alpha subunit